MSPPPSPTRFATWLDASRPKTLTAAVVPVAVGTAVAYLLGAFRPLPALAALLGAIAIQIGTNFANDVFDAEKGADTEDRLGPTRAVAAGLISPDAMRRAMVIAFGLAGLAGVYLVGVAGWPIVVIGVASVLSGIAYTGGPYPLGYHGLGDLFVLVFFGFVAVAGTTYVQTGTLSLVALAAGLPVGALATAILVVNNVRDRHTDVHAGKRTLAVRFGKAAALAEYATCLLSAYVVPLLLAFGLGRPFVILPLVTLPWAARLFGELRDREGRPLNDTLASTAQLLLVYGVLFTLGLVLGGPRSLAI